MKKSIVFLLALLMLVGCSNTKGDDLMWTTTWSQSQKGLALFPRNDLDRTVQYAIPVHHDGANMRMSFSNYYGSQELELSNIAVSLSEDTDFLDLKFSGKSGFILQAETDITSDSLSLDMKKDTTLYIRLTYAENDLTKRPVSGGLESLSAQRGPKGMHEEFIKEAWTTDSFPADSEANMLAEWYEAMQGKFMLTLSNLEVETATNKGAIVAFGDSITEQNHWFAPFETSIYDTYGQDYAITNAAISGNRLLGASEGIPNSMQVFGRSGLDRFKHDVFEVNSNVSHVIFAVGLNDLYQPGNDGITSIDSLPDAQALIQGYESIIALAHEHGAKIYITTLTPFDGASLNTEMAQKEAIRNSVNEWIRTTDLSDGFIEFDHAIADKAAPSKINPSFDSGDHLHPNAEGGKALSNAINLDLFK